MTTHILNIAYKALQRQHKSYGEMVRLIKYMPSSTGGIYRQRKRLYEAPYEIKASISRTPIEETLSRIGESSEREATMTLPISFAKELFGNSTDVNNMITTSDLIIFDNRVWRIIQSAQTGRIGDEPLLLYILLREKLGAKTVDYE
jgi:hypothetical protein